MFRRWQRGKMPEKKRRLPIWLVLAKLNFSENCAHYNLQLILTPSHLTRQPNHFLFPPRTHSFSLFHTCTHNSQRELIQATNVMKHTRTDRARKKNWLCIAFGGFVLTLITHNSARSEFLVRLFTVGMAVRNKHSARMWPVFHPPHSPDAARLVFFPIHFVIIESERTAAGGGKGTGCYFFFWSHFWWCSGVCVCAVSAKWHTTATTCKQCERQLMTDQNRNVHPTFIYMICT